MTTYIPYDNFLPEVTPFCNGVPYEVAVNAIRNAAIEFCEETDWLQNTPAAVTGVAGTAAYQFAAPGDTIVARVAQAWYDTFPLVEQSEEQLNAKCGVDWRSLQGGPRYYTQTDDITSIVIVPFPQITEAGALTALTVLRPSRASTTCDSTLFEWWLEVIAAGARAKLQSTPAQPYTSMSAAAVSAGLFRAGIFKARADRNRGMTRANLVMRPPRFF